MPVSRAVGAAHAQAFATTAALAASAVPAASSGPSPYSISSAAAVSPASSWLANLQAAADGACLAGNALQCSVLQQYAASAAVLSGAGAGAPAAPADAALQSKKKQGSVEDWLGPPTLVLNVKAIPPQVAATAVSLAALQARP